MRIPTSAAYSCALAVAITLAGCGSDGSQSLHGFSPVGSTQSATTSAIQFKWFSAKLDLPPGPPGKNHITVKCSAPFTHIVAGGYEEPIVISDITVRSNRPASSFDGWFVEAVNNLKTPDSMTVWADCTNA